MTSETPGDSNAGVRRGLYVAPFDELADPRTLIALAVEAEEHGWDGFFLWDHIVYRPPVRAVADPWVALSAIAAHTEHLRLGPLVTPLSRRRVHKAARETATLDRLSRGRLIFGVGLGSDRNGELERFGEVVDARERARRLDPGLDRLTEFWDGEFEPQPVQRPRIRDLDRGTLAASTPPAPGCALGRDLPDELPGPGALAELADEISGLRSDDPKPFELVVDLEPGLELEPWRQAGATWILTDFGPQPQTARVREVIARGPHDDAR